MIIEKQRFTSSIDGWLNCLNWWLRTVLVLITLFSIIFLPIEIKTIQLSMDSKSPIFVILITVVIGIKYLTIADWYLIAFNLAPSSFFRYIHYIITGLGVVITFVSAVVTGFEIYLAMQGLPINIILTAIILHPFMINFEVFLICSIAPIVMLVVEGCKSTEYSEIPQMVYPMEQFNEIRFSTPSPQLVFDPSPMYPMDALKGSHFVNTVPETKSDKKPLTPSFIPYYVGS